MPRRSRPSGRPSTTSRRTSKDRVLALLRRRPSDTEREPGQLGSQEPKSLLELIEELPAQRAEAVFTHASWAADRTLSYERLEFLGDSVLELAIARTLFDRYPEFSEGRMAKVRSHVVSRASCAVVALELELGERMRTAAAGLAPDEVDRLARNRNVLAALLEAALAAVYLEHGFEAVEPAVVAAFESQLEYALNTYVDHKTELQERLARLGLSVSYTTLTVEGPPHDRSFTAAAIIDGQVVGTGEGRSKKDAEQAAAAQALVDVPAPAA
jgi:ribonuclease-3